LNKLITLYILCSSLILAGCVTSGPVLLNRGGFETNKISEISLYSENINIKPELSNQSTVQADSGIAGLLVGGVIDASSNKKRRNTFTPLEEALSSSKLDEYVESQLKEKLSGFAFSSPIKISRIEKGTFEKSSRELVPSVEPTATLSNNYVVLTVSLQVSVKQKPELKNYDKIYSTQKVVGSIKQERAELISNFSKDPNKLIETTKLAYDEVIDQFVQDFNGIK